MSKVHYSSTIGSLMHAMVYTHYDILHVVSVVSRYMANPGKLRWHTIQWIFIYLWGTSNMCLEFGRNQKGLVEYVDSNYA